MTRTLRSWALAALTVSGAVGFTVAVPTQTALADPPTQCGYIPTNWNAYWGNCSIYGALVQPKLLGPNGYEWGLTVRVAAKSRGDIGPTCCSGYVVRGARQVGTY